jgi:hypothetical protein
VERAILSSLPGQGSPKPSRPRGEIETLPSGPLTVRVYAGIEALTGERHYLVETRARRAEGGSRGREVRRRLVNQVDEQRNRAKATVNQ